MYACTNAHTHTYTHTLIQTFPNTKAHATQTLYYNILHHAFSILTLVLVVLLPLQLTQGKYIKIKIEKGDGYTPY